MKKLVKRSTKRENTLRPYCSCYMCGCYCRPYEDNTSERYDSKQYTIATEGV
ncbi:CLI_3235 family bacteriocin precursor [Clostridium sp. UBA1056]|uniref:CLI_3235 family bacteriocin precursor n=1 Tax=unclassified Clostridium TaxID=2614128 RepID=UPI0032175B2B